MSSQKPVTTKSQAMYADGAVLGELVTLTQAEWKVKYRPGKRLKPRNSWGNIDPETDAAVLAAIEKDPRLVWTELQLESRRIIVNGWCFVNREAYYISEVPFDSMTDQIEVKT